MLAMGAVVCRSSLRCCTQRKLWYNIVGVCTKRPDSLKHAFPPFIPPACGGKEGECEILVTLHSDNDKLTLIVSDNGVGFPRDLDFPNAETLGLRLVSMLNRQLRGTIELDRSDGTAFKITFAGPKS